MNHDSFDALLGPSDERYFGSGYRESAQRCEDVRVHRPAPGRLVVTASAHLDPWLRRGVGRIQHLGTVDAIAVAVTVASIALIAAGRAPLGRECPLFEVAVRAGSSAETAVDGIPVTAEWMEQPGPRSSEEVLCRIGRLTVRVCLETHGPDAGAGLPEGPVDPDAVLGPRERRYFAEGYRMPALSARDVHVGERLASCGLTPATHHDPGVIECLVVTSQLAQALLYEAAGVRREETGNLWMRRCEFTAAPSGPAAGRAELEVVRVHRLERTTPAIVTADVRIRSFPGWDGTASLAFEVRAGG
jgi:hypothetical protein